MAKQDELIEGRGIKEIDAAAERVKELTDSRMAVLRNEVEAREQLLALMKKHGKETYNYNGYEVEVVPGKERVKVKSQKEAEAAREELG